MTASVYQRIAAVSRLYTSMMMIAALLAAQVIHSMDDLKVRQPKEKGRSEAVEGRSGKAVRFSFDDGSSGQFCITSLRGKPEWDQAAGFSFWVKGDGSKTLGGLQFIWNDDYAARRSEEHTSELQSQSNLVCRL